MNEKYQATEINSNLFNIYEYHNSFTASSHFKHSPHTTFDKPAVSSQGFIEIPSLLIEKALSKYDSVYYSHYEDIEEPKSLDFSLEKTQSDNDPNFCQPNPPFEVSDVSVIEHHPANSIVVRQDMLADIEFCK